MKRLFLVWALLIVAVLVPGLTMAGSFEVGLSGGGIAKVDRDATLDAGGTTASATVTVAKIPLAAAEHSPHCSAGRWTISGIPVAGNRMSECVRVCVRPPTGYETNGATGITGTTSHAWSQVFNPEWFNDTKIACIHVKNWSDSLESVATVTIGVCPAGSGCAKTAPPPAPPQVVATVREREPYVSPMRRRLSD
jgi:hypothetical protein